MNERNLKTSELVDQLYEGILVDEPMHSRVSGTFLNGHFYGTIKSLRRGTFYLESSKPYYASSTFDDDELILYDETSINLNSSNNGPQSETLNLFDGPNVLSKIPKVNYICTNWDRISSFN